jgi:hypothetical protein
MGIGVQLTFDAADPGALARFWAVALGYVEQPPPEGFASWDAWCEQMGIPVEHRNDRAAVVDPDGRGPRILFQKVPEPKVAKNRLHVDVAVGGAGPKEQRRARIDAEAVRLKGLGASDHRGVQDEADGYWVRMNDPEGNEFCLV